MLKKIIALTTCLTMVISGIAYAATSVQEIEAPKKLTVELKKHEDGYPYFQMKVEVPASIEKLAEKAEEDGADIFIETEYKVGNDEWTSAGGVHITVGNVIDMNPDDMGIEEEVDIKANVYSFRVRFGYYTKVAGEDGNMIADGNIFSPFSNTVSVGIDAYKKSYKDASPWAEPELDKASEYGFITERIQDKMNGPITREELCEVIMKLYENMVGSANYTDTNVFTDTNNPEIFKAYELGIVNGIGNSKFAPNELTNREQVAAMMFRAVKVLKQDADLSIDGVEKFADEDQISTWALESIKFMNKNGLIKGSNGKVDPKGTTTREQAVLIIVRIFEQFNK